MKAPPPRFYRSAVYLLRVAAPSGLLVSFYLVRQHIQYATTGALDSPLCSVGGLFDCTRIEASGYSSFFGIPIASVGVFYFAMLTLMSWTVRAGGGNPGQQRWQSLFGWMTIPAFAVAWGLAMLSGLVIGGFCLGCTAVYGIVILCVAAPALASPGRYLDSLKAGPSLASDFLSRRLFREAALRTKTMVGLIATLAIGIANVAVPPWLIAHRGRVEASVTGQQRIESFFRQPVVELQPSPAGMTKGDPNSDLHIVVFTDFKCQFCRKFEGELRGILERRTGDYFLSTKHFPLSRECNPVMRQATFDHPQACRLALLAEAMGDLGFFEEWGSALYLEGVSELYPALKEIATQAGEDMHAWAGRSQRTDIRERVERDIEEGLRLGLRGVPAVFVNGRQLASTNPEKVEEIFTAIDAGTIFSAQE